MRPVTPERPALEDIAARTMTGDVRDFLLGHVRHMPKAWPQMNEAEQRSFIDATERHSEALIRKIVGLVGSQGFESFEISVGDLSKKGNRLEAKLTAPYSRETLGDLAEAGEAGPIVLSLASMEMFRGQRAPAKPAPDQLDLMESQDQTAADGAVEAGDKTAADLQAEAMGEALGEQPEGRGEATEEAAAEPLSPEAIENGERLTNGIKGLIAEPNDGAAETTPKRRGRRTVNERVAEAGVLADQPPPAKRQRRSKATAEHVEAAQATNT